jgi:hypothetical protein
VVSDALSLTSILSAVGIIAFLPLIPTISAVSAFVFALSVAIYWIGHTTLLGGVDGSYVAGVIRKQLLTGVAVLYAYNRVGREGVDWNMVGFKPENIPRYKF